MVVVCAGSSLVWADGIVVGAGAGGSPQVEVFDFLIDGTTVGGKQLARILFAYDPGFAGGVRVAAGDLNGDGVADIITGTGPGTPGDVVRVFNGVTYNQIAEFLAYDYIPGFSGGIFVAVGDKNFVPGPEIVTGPGDGSTNGEVAAFDPMGTYVGDVYPWNFGFTDEIRVAVGDINSDGVDDIIAGGGPGAGTTQVRLINGDNGTSLGVFTPFAGFTGGVFVAAGDFNNDQHADIIVGADAGGSPQVKVFDGTTFAELAGFLAFDPLFTGGVRVGAGDINGDGVIDIITGAGPGGAPQVNVFSGSDNSLLSSFFAFDPSFTGGVYVAGVPDPIPEPASAVTLLILTGAYLARRRR